MPPLNEQQLNAEQPADESSMFDILVALLLALPPAVRDEREPADVLRANGYCHLDALRTLTVGDLELLGFVRGHSAMIMALIRPPPNESHEVPLIN